MPMNRRGHNDTEKYLTDPVGCDILYTGGIDMTKRKRDNKEDAGIGLKDRQKIEIRKPRRFQVIFVNDDSIPAKFVLSLLETVFHMSPGDALKSARRIDKRGEGSVGTYTKEIADTKAHKCLTLARNKGLPLVVLTKPE